MANTIAPIQNLQLMFGSAPGAAAATAQTVTPGSAAQPLGTNDKIVLVWNHTDGSIVDPETVTITAANTISIVASTSSKTLLIGWHASNVN